MTRFTIVLFAALAITAACKKSDDAAAPGGAAKTTEAKAGPVKLDKLKLQLDIAGEAPTVGDGIMGDGVMLQGESIGAMNVEEMKKPTALEEEKSDAEMFSPKHLVAEKLPDGWVVTFDNTGSAGANFFVTVRRDIAGKSYKCSTTVPDADRAKAVLAACKSLRS